MNELADSLLSRICHRQGVHSDLLPLCLRCSCVYAGALAGAVFETVRRALGGGHPGNTAYWMGGTGLLLMAAVGFGGLYRQLAVPDVVKVFTALYFGWSVAFLALASTVRELELARSPCVEWARWRWAFMAVLVAWTAAVGLGWAWVLHVLAVLAVAGVVTTFVLVNLAVSLVLLRRVRRRLWRIALSAAMVPTLTATELVLFSVWRRP